MRLMKSQLRVIVGNALGVMFLYNSGGGTSAMARSGLSIADRM